MSLATVPQYDSNRMSKQGERVVVIGAGMAGLLAARVLADVFDEVVVLERDPLPDESTVRRGIPQGRHIHVMLEAGRATLEDLFPGYRKSLLSAGGLEIDGARDVDFYVEGDFLATGPHPLPHYAATRPLYEQLLRRHLSDISGIQIRPRCQFSDYLIDDGASVIEGAVFTNEEKAIEKLHATLVVDATGRTSRTPAWLERHGYTSPTIDEVYIDLAYSTVFIQRPEDDHRSILVSPSPSNPRAAGILPIENNRWVVTVAGMHGNHPPMDANGFTDFAASLPVPAVRQLLEEHTWISDEVAHYPFPASLRHRYENLDRFPEGLVVTGDGIASFNPLYGQGMSVAALEALLLHHALRTEGLENLAPRFFERSQKVVDIAWTMAVGADFQFSQTTGPKPRATNIMNRYVSRLHRKAHTDGELRDAFFRVLMMDQPPTSLLRPEILWRVLSPIR